MTRLPATTENKLHCMALEITQIFDKKAFLSKEVAGWSADKCIYSFDEAQENDMSKSTDPDMS